MDTFIATLSPDHRIARERQWRLLMDADENSDVEGLFLSALKDKLGHDDIPPGVSRTLRFASEVQYQHGTVPSRVYLKHPLRVATLLVRELSKLDEQTITTALLHNVLEVSDLTESKLKDIVGTDVAKAIRILTVDRARQYDFSYKDEYYRQIEATSLSCAQVKVADKLDNIYMLCFNPAADIRNQYLHEIDRWVVPMARRVIPALGERMAEASIVIRETGYLEKNTELEKARRM